MRNGQKLSDLVNKSPLFSNRKNLAYLVESIPTAVYTTDENGIVTYYNQKAAEIWGQHPRLNHPSTPRYCGSYKVYTHDGTFMPLEKSWIAIALETQQEITDKEVIFERPDGSQVIALVNISPLFDDGEFVGAMNVMMDITKQKKIEKDVYRLAAIVDSSEDAIVSKTLNGVVTSWNKGAEQIFGYTQEEMVGRHITTIIPPERHQEEDMILGNIRKGRRVDHFESIRVAKSGKRLPISLTVSPIKDDKGRIIGASKIARNISDQVQSRKRLEKLNNELKKHNRYKDQFIGMASHELKTPITVIKSNLELLSLKVADSSIQPLIEKTLSNIDKLTALVSSLLDVSKVEGGKLRLNYSRFDVSSLIKDCIKTMQVSAPSYRFVFEEPSADVIINADRQRIEQVIINLLNNAVKYSPDADKVIIDVQAGEDDLTISITDFGIGIPKELQEKVFSRFFRADSLTSAYDGLGIGLFISKDIVKRHRGKIWIESKVDKGSTFHINLPVNPFSEVDQQ